jgi:LPS-assembly lipoprotein
VTIVVEQAHRDLEPLLKEQLQSYHVQINPDPTSAHYWLILEKDDVQQHITSVSSSTTPRQYQLVYQVQFKLQQAKGKEMLPSSFIVVSRQVTINSNRILGSNEEEALLKMEMRREAATQIIYRLSRAQEQR